MTKPFTKLITDINSEDKSNGFESKENHKISSKAMIIIGIFLSLSSATILFLYIYKVFS